MSELSSDAESVVGLTPISAQRLDADGIPRTMRWWGYLGDAQGMVVNNLIGGLVGLLTYFYTDKVGMAAGSAALSLLLAKIIDACAMLAVGPMVDRTHTRWGKARPWFLAMVIPAAICVPLLFMMPASLSGTGKFWWALATNVFATGVVLTSINTPYGVLLVYSTKSRQERTTMSVWRALFSFLAGLVVAVGAIPITNALGGTQSAWLKLAIIAGCVSAAATFIVFITGREHYADDPEAKAAKDVPYAQGLGFLFRNRYWVVLLVYGFFINIMWAIQGSAGPYYAKWIFHDDNIAAVLSAAGFLPIVIGFGLVGPLIKRLGLTRLLRIGLVMSLAAAIVRAVFFRSLPVQLGAGFIGGLGMVPLMVGPGVLGSFVAEYNELKFGHNLAGLSGAVSGFGAQVSGGIGASLIGALLGLGGYDAKLVTQPRGAILAILAFTIWIPGLLALIQLVLLHGFDLEQRYPGIVAELAERRAAHAAAAAEAAPGSLLTPEAGDGAVDPQAATEMREALLDAAPAVNEDVSPGSARAGVVSSKEFG